MKFIIENVHLWLNEGNEHISHTFQKNKINVITGGGDTGKTCILKILDYCFFAEKNDIPDDVNEQVCAYGVTFIIKEDKVTIIREASHEGNKVSLNYLFLDKPKYNPANFQPDFFKDYSVRESVVKSYFEKRFNITETFQLLPKGNKIRKGSTLNLKYFFLFNTISQSILLNKMEYFDFNLNKRDSELYRQALDSIFDLSIGLSSEENYRLRQQITEVDKELDKINNAKIKQEKKIRREADFIQSLIFKSKEYELIDDEIDEENIEEAFKILKSRIDQEYNELNKPNLPKEFKILERKRYDLRRKIKTLKSFKNEIIEYKNLLTEEQETILPLQYLEENKMDLISLTEVKDFLDQLRLELNQTRSKVQSINPIGYNVDEELMFLKKELEGVEQDLSKYPKNKKFIDNNQKSIFLIETKKDIEHFLGEKNKFKYKTKDYEIDLKFYNNKRQELESKLPRDINQDKSNKINQLNDLIQDKLDQVKSCLGNYRNFKANFNYLDKLLELRKPYENNSISIDGVSNFLFLQVALFLGLHELFIIQKDQNYIPQFLIIDYPSLPYQPSEETKSNTIKEGDMYKLKQLLKLFSNFIKVINERYEQDFQIILLEHIEPSIWEDEKELQNFHLVDEFVGGKTLLKSNV